MRAGGRDRLGGSITGEAVFAVRSSIDVPGAWAEAKKTPDGAKKIAELVEGVRRDLGLDLEADLIQNLVGDTSVVVLETGTGMVPVDVVGWTAIQEAPKVTAFFDAGSARLRTGGIEHSVDRTPDQVWYSRADLAIGIAEGHLISTWGAGRMAAVRASLGGGQPSFLSLVPPEVRRGLEQGPGAFLWMDLARTERVGKAFARQFAALLGTGASGSMDDAAALFTGLSAGIDNRVGLTVFETTAWAVPGGVAAALSARATEMQRRAARAEAPANVDGILTAQRAHHAAFGRWVPCGSEAEARRSLSVAPHDWTASPCWNALGWRPDGQVRGGYWVSVDRFGFRVEVHGLIDTDGDGRPAEFVADNFQAARMITPVDVY